MPKNDDFDDVSSEILIVSRWYGKLKRCYVCMVGSLMFCDEQSPSQIILTKLCNASHGSFRYTW